MSKQPVCHEEVTRQGEFDACGKVAVARRMDQIEQRSYPVCSKHCRGDMVPLAIESPTTVEWGTMTVDNPTGVNIVSEAKARADTERWNDLRWVREGTTPRGSVVSRKVGPWIAVQS